METAPLRVFVTGSTGFVGAHVVRALSDAGHHVTALARDASRAAPLRSLADVTVVVGDLATTSSYAPSLASHDACVHVALLWGDAAQDLELADVRASARLFEAAAEAGVEHMIYTSSTAVHRPLDPVMRAEMQLRSADYYGATKASGEVFLSAVCHHHSMRGNVLRPGAVVGAPAVEGAPVKIDRHIASMIDAAKRGEPIRIARGAGRQFIGARSLARLYVSLLASPRNHARYIAVAPEVITWEEVASMVIDAVGAGRVEVDDAPAVTPAVFDVSETEAELGAIADARAELREGVRARAESR